MVLPDSNWPRFHLWKTLYHGQQGPSTLGKPDGSDHEYTLSEPTAVANDADWLHLSTRPSSKDTLVQGSTRFLNTRKTVSHELQSTFWPFILDQTIYTHFFLAKCSG